MNTKIICGKCNKEVTPILTPSGPHIKASCSICGSYIKFVSKDNKFDRGMEINSMTEDEFNAPKWERPTLESIREMVKNR